MSRRNHFRNLQQKRYDTKRFQNPYFQKQFELPWKLLSSLVGSLVFLTLTSLFFFRHEIFSIRFVELQGVQYLPRSELEAEIQSFLVSRTWLFFQQANRFLVNSTALAEQLQKKFVLEQLEITIKNQTLKIAIEERTSQLLWKTGEKLYLVDVHGVVIRETDAVLSLPIFVDQNAVKVIPGATVLTEDEITAILFFQTEIGKMGVSVNETQIDRLAGKWIGVLTQQGYRILFDPTGNLDEQLARLRLLLTQTIQEPHELEYIDLRFGDHVYYK